MSMKIGVSSKIKIKLGIAWSVFMTVACTLIAIMGPKEWSLVMLACVGINAFLVKEWIDLWRLER